MRDADFALVVLHYRTTNETADFLSSAEKYYPGLRILVVDNGSPENDLEPLKKCSPGTTSFLRLPENRGFARGMNAGITFLRKEGYSTIICSTNDVLLLDSDSLPLLISPLLEGGIAVSGPRILTPKGRNQNPLLAARPDLAEAKKMVRYYSLGNIWSRYLLNRYLLSPLKKRFRKKRPPEAFLSETEKKEGKRECFYALNGAFFVLGPGFFEGFEGLDPRTFLYGEELILAEMVHQADMKMAYVPSARVFHKEDKTSDLVWGGEDRIQPALYARESIRYWYNELYLPFERRGKE